MKNESRRRVTFRQYLHRRPSQSLRCKSASGLPDALSVCPLQGHSTRHIQTSGLATVSRSSAEVIAYRGDHSTNDQENHCGPKIQIGYRAAGSHTGRFRSIQYCRSLSNTDGPVSPILPSSTAENRAGQDSAGGFKVSGAQADQQPQDTAF